MKRILLSVLISLPILLCKIVAPEAAVTNPEPSKEPRLRIETTMHYSSISQVATERSGRYLVTASTDRTIRVWSAVTGELLKVIRPPLSNSPDNLYTVALSPDGAIIAAGGYTKTGSDSGFTVYLFNRNSGAMLNNIRNLPKSISSLAFSPDGRYLAVGLFDSGGVKVFETTSLTELFNAEHFKGGVKTAFSQRGLLAVGDADGLITLYDSGFLKIQSAKTSAGAISSIAFSPDERFLGVGYSESPQVEILSAQDLTPLYTANSTKVPKHQNLGKLAWSADGRFLYAAGTYSIKQDGLFKKVVRRWSQQGRGVYQDIPIAENSIFSLAAMPDNSIAFATADPILGILAQDGTVRMNLLPQTPDFRTMEDNFRVSSDGLGVQFQTTTQRTSLTFFSVAERSLQIKPEKTGELTPPLTQYPGIECKNWKNTKNISLNGTPLKAAGTAMSRALSILPDGSGFILGQSKMIGLYNADGSKKWKVSSIYEIWAVNVAMQAGLVVSAVSDGSIRWQRLSDGKTLCYLFIHRDQKRWVLWTPEGYYDASPGGEELIGWHINNGRDQAADFFLASKFRSTKYRPDVIAKVFETKDTKEAIRLANAERGITVPAKETEIAAALPPVVTISSPGDGSTVESSTIAVRYTVRTPSNEPVTAIRVLVDGRPVAANRGLKAVAKDTNEQTVHVSIPEKNSEISIIAENRFSASEPATIRLTWAGKAPQKDEFILKPKLYVLAVGISAYQLPDLKLQFAAKDARDFAAAVQLQKGGMYRDVTIKLLPDATKDDVLDGLEWLQKEVTSKDVAMVFLAGHGVNDSAGTYYFLPVNVDPEKLKRTGVPFSDIKNTLAALAGKAILFVDTCHSGNVMGSGRRALTDVNAIVNELASAENGVVVFASSTGRQYSLEDKVWGNGAFTKALVEGLRGKADYGGKGRITINMLDLYLAERVKELTGGKQTPTTSKPTTVPDFPVALNK